jgi:hypothetical protein
MVYSVRKGRFVELGLEVTCRTEGSFFASSTVYYKIVNCVH